MTKEKHPNREKFPFFVDIPTRWMDSDMYGHVNNVEYYSYIDTAVNMHLVKKIMLDPNTAPVFGVVAETGCKYFREIRHPDIVETGIRVTRIGNSSVTYQAALFRRSDESLAALGHFVHVYVDRKTRKPTTIPNAFRKELNKILT
ncbi:MAG: thioesterase family protein [Pseudomonadota bacterium]|nr:thioesterase family protein [Pseudomonadota bacterium]